MTTVTWGVPSNPSIITTKLQLQVSHKINVHVLVYAPQFSWSEQIRLTQSLSFTKLNIDLDNMKNANLASLLILIRISFLSTAILFH